MLNHFAEAERPSARQSRIVGSQHEKGTPLAIRTDRQIRLLSLCTYFKSLPDIMFPFISRLSFVHHFFLLLTVAGRLTCYSPAHFSVTARVIHSNAHPKSPFHSCFTKERQNKVPENKNCCTEGGYRWLKDYLYQWKLTKYQKNLTIAASKITIKLNQDLSGTDSTKS